MSIKSIGFIGGGRIANVFLGGWSRTNALLVNVLVYDCNQEVTDKLKARYPHVQIASLTDAASQDVVFLAVHPPVVASVLPEVGKALKSDGILVSLVPKFRIVTLAEMLGGFNRITRMIPNAASIVRKGYNPTTFSNSLPETDQFELIRLFSLLGECVEVPEAQLETYAVVSAMGLTFLWPQLDMLASLAESSGLPRVEALQGIEGMLLGAVAALRDSGLSPAEVQDLVPVRPLADEVNAFVGAARPKLEGILAKFRS
jgi:pyrroline-5-carboxylate reductase